MPREATVYQVLLVAPADVSSERSTATDVVLEWNATHGTDENVHLEPIVLERDRGGWSGVAREELLEHCDLVVGIFWSETGNGGVDAFTELAFEQDVPAIVGFSQRDIPADDLDPDEFQTVQDLKQRSRNAGCFFTYETTQELQNQLTQELAFRMNRILGDSSGVGCGAADEDSGPSEYDPEVDRERLEQSAAIHREQDERNLEAILSHFRERGIEPPYRVLDAGCGYGTVTKSRFGDDDRFDVVAIDNVEEVVRIAREEYDAENIDYRWLDVHDVDADSLGTFDLVFTSYLFHHLDQQEPVLSQLWDVVAPDGALFVRTCEDGQHLHYPPDESMDWIVDVTDEIPGSSDRTHGRRIYTHMNRLSPDPERVELDLKNYHTAGKTSSEREAYWDVFHSNRLHYAEVRSEREDATREDRERYERLSKEMERLREKFVDNEHFLDTKSVPVAVAYKG